MKPGFYLVRTSDSQRFFVSGKVSQSALENCANKALSEKTGWNYWIDKCLGIDVHGKQAWMNLDYTDNFI